MKNSRNNPVTIGLIQMRCSENADENMNKALSMVEDAARKGAKIVSLSELFLGPYFCQVNDKKFFHLAEPIPGPSTEKLSQAAKTLGISIVASLYERTADFQYFNTALTINPDGTFTDIYRKIHIPDDPENHYSEMFYFKPGDRGFKCFETPFARVGTLVCWDQWYPEAARATTMLGAEIIFYPTAIGWQISQQNQEIGSSEFDAWITIQRSHAIANGIFVAAVNRIGLEDNINFWGGSFVADPYGKIIAQASHDKEEVLLALCDFSRIEFFRKDWPFLTCRRIDTYGQLTQPYTNKNR